MLKRTQHLQSKHSPHRTILIMGAILVCVLLVLIGIFKMTSNHRNDSQPVTKTYSRDSHMSGVKTSPQSRFLTKIQNLDSDEADVELTNNGTQLQFTYERTTGFNKFKNVTAPKQYQQYLKVAKKTSKQVRLKVIMSSNAKDKLNQQLQKKRKQQQEKQQKMQKIKQQQRQKQKEQQQKEMHQAQQKQKKVNQQKQNGHKHQVKTRTNKNNKQQSKSSESQKRNKR